MGVDVYLRYPEMNEEEKQKQITGFDVTCGRFGYLRASYGGHVALEAVELLLKGVNWDKDWKVNVKKLKTNLSELKKTLFKERAKEFYGGLNGAEQQSYIDFVALAEKWSNEGKKPFIHISY